MPDALTTPCPNSGRSSANKPGCLKMNVLIQSQSTGSHCLIQSMSAYWRPLGTFKGQELPSVPLAMALTQDWEFCEFYEFVSMVGLLWVPLK